MSVCCGKHSANRPTAKTGDYFLSPNEPCVFCAEKHISDAWELSRECGYETPNRQTIIGALTCAARHLRKEHADTAERVRAFRHDVQLRGEADLDWRPMLAEIDALANEEAAKLKEQEKNQ